MSLVKKTRSKVVFIKRFRRMTYTQHKKALQFVACSLWYLKLLLTTHLFRFFASFENIQKHTSCHTINYFYFLLTTCENYILCKDNLSGFHYWKFGGLYNVIYRRYLEIMTNSDYIRKRKFSLKCMLTIFDDYKPSLSIRCIFSMFISR